MNTTCSKNLISTKKSIKVRYKQLKWKMDNMYKCNIFYL